jgi:long-subunit fatty acid transport protein
LRNVEVYNYYKNPNNWTRADAIMKGAAASFTDAAAGTQLLINNNFGTMTLEQAQGATVINAETRAKLEGALTALGYPAATPISSANAIFNGAAAQYGAKAMLLGDQEADTKRTGIGFAPIIAIDFKPNEQLNIGLKYTHQANIELEYKTAKDFTTGMKPDGTPITKFPNGQKNRLDMPSTLSAGVTYKPIEKLLVSVSCDYFFDKQANWSGREDSLDGNGIEAGIGFEYSLTEKLALSTGYMYSKPGIAAGCQSDMGFELNAHSIAFGGKYKLNEMIEINAGIEYSAYEDFDKNFNRNNIAYKETYGKHTLIGGLGLNIYFGK